MLCIKIYIPYGMGDKSKQKKKLKFSSTCVFLSLKTDKYFFYFSLDQNKAVAEVEQLLVATKNEFKERAGFNRRRGAMRRRVHQVCFCKDIFLNLILAIYY